jgi:hypothetical protein
MLINEVEQEKYGRNFVYIKRSEKLIVVMSAHNQGEKYMSFKTFHNNISDSLLFLNNPENSWYTDKNDSYKKILFDILKEYRTDNIIFYGSSMSGYAAIMFAIHFNANALSINPQINLNLSEEICWPDLKESLSKLTSPRLALEKYCLDNWNESVIYILHGHHILDRENIDLFSKIRSNNKKLIVQTIDCDNHDNYIGNNTTLIKKIFNLILDFRGIEKIEEKKDDILKNRRVNINSKIVNVSRFENLDENAELWHNRNEFEKSHSIIHFKDIGLYNEQGVLSGAFCAYNGRNWQLLSPLIDNNYNLLSNSSFNFELEHTTLVNNENFLGNWWSRLDTTSNIKANVANNELVLDIEHSESKNLYISCCPEKKLLTSNLSNSNRYLTFLADVCSDNGEVHLTLGGRTHTSYFHSNSKKLNTRNWQKVSVSQLFSDIKMDHKDFIFCRVFYNTDLKNKKVKIKNPTLIEGYFPENLVI